jgi:ATP-dependent Zn protease
MIAKIMTSLGGRISEEIVFGKKSITAGSYEDIRDVTEKVNNFILEFGMSELGMVDFKYSSISELSEKAKERIEDIRRKLLRKCAKKARDLIIKNRVCLDLIAKELIEKKSIHRNEINYIFVNKISPNIKLLKSC